MVMESQYLVFGAAAILTIVSLHFLVSSRAAALAAIITLHIVSSRQKQRRRQQDDSNHLSTLLRCAGLRPAEFNINTITSFCKTNKLLAPA